MAGTATETPGGQNGDGGDDGNGNSGDGSGNSDNGNSDNGDSNSDNGDSNNKTDGESQGNSDANNSDRHSDTTNDSDSGNGDPSDTNRTDSAEQPNDAPSHTEHPSYRESDGTIPATDAPRKPTQEDIDTAVARAPGDENGVPIDPRTGDPLRLDGDGRRDWVLRYEPESDSFVARNPGGGYTYGGRPLPEMDVDSARVEQYASGQAEHPGIWPPTNTPNPPFDASAGQPGFADSPRSPGQPGMEFQQQVSGLDPSSNGRIIEYNVPDPETGRIVRFDGRVERGGPPPEEVFLEAKDGYRILAASPEHPKAKSMAENLKNEAARQSDAIPEGASLEWHVSDPKAAVAIQKLTEEVRPGMIDVIYTPKV